MAVGKSSIERANSIRNNKTSQRKSQNFVQNTNEVISHKQPYSAYVSIDKLQAVPTEWYNYKETSQSLENLKESIYKFGVLESILVRRTGDDNYQLLSGYKRVEVCKCLDIKTIKAEILEDVSDEYAHEIIKQLNLPKTWSSECDVDEIDLKMELKIEKSSVDEIKRLPCNEIPDYLL